MSEFYSTDDLDRPLSNYERGLIHKSLGSAADVEFLDDDEIADYMRGYNEAWSLKGLRHE